MNTIEKIRNSKLQPKWLPWVWVTGMTALLITLILNISSGRAELAAVNSCGVSLFALAAYALNQARINKRLVEEIDRLRSNQSPNS